MTARICKSAQVSTPVALQFSLSSLETLSANQLGSLRRIITRILSTYVDDKAYSVELVAANPPSKFIYKENLRVEMDYSCSFFDDVGDELALQHAISRYHAFVSPLICHTPHFQNARLQTSGMIPTSRIPLYA